MGRPELGGWRNEPGAHATAPWRWHCAAAIDEGVVSRGRTTGRTAGAWQTPPSRDTQHIAFVSEVEHLWETGQGPRKACVIRSRKRKKGAWDHMVLGLMDHRLTGPWIVRHYAERPEIAPEHEQMQSGGGQLKQRSATCYSDLVLYILTVVLSYSLSPLFANTQAGARFVDKTRQALAFAPLRNRRTPSIAYAGGSFERFEPLSFARLILQRPPAAPARLRHWLDDHLHTVQQRE